MRNPNLFKILEAAPVVKSTGDVAQRVFNNTRSFCNPNGTIIIQTPADPEVATDEYAVAAMMAFQHGNAQLLLSRDDAEVFRHWLCRARDNYNNALAARRDAQVSGRLLDLHLKWRQDYGEV